MCVLASSRLLASSPCGPILRPSDPLPPAIVVERRNERGDADEAGIGEQCRDFADAADVLLPVLGREAQVGVEATAHVVAVDRVRRPAAIEQCAFEGHRECRLAGAGQSGQPHNGSAMTGTRAALGGGNMMVDSNDVM